MTHAEDLRRWAKGTYTTEAATELLLRAFNGRFAEPGNPWIHTPVTTGHGTDQGGVDRFRCAGRGCP